MAPAGPAGLATEPAASDPANASVAPHRPSSCLRLAALAVICVFLAEPAAAETVRAELQRMGEAMRALSYEGVFVYSQGDRAESMRVVHGTIDGEPHRRVSAISGEPLEIIRRGDQVIWVMPDEERALVGSTPRGLLPGAFAGRLEHVPESYRLSDEGMSRMTDRKARIIEILPVDDDRYGYRLWLDQETALLLRSDLLAADGTVRERLMFTELTLLDDIDRERFAYPLDELERVERVAGGGMGSRAGGKEKISPLMPDPPSGFKLVAVDGEPDGEGGRQHAVFSDGLASVSVFVELDNGKEGFVAEMNRRGAVHMKSRRMGGARVTVVGALPSATIDRMVDSLEPATQ